MNFSGNTVSIDISGNSVLLKDGVRDSPLPCLSCTSVQIRRCIKSVLGYKDFTGCKSTGNQPVVPVSSHPPLQRELGSLLSLVLMFQIRM